MYWDNLKTLNCPKCEKDLERNEHNNTFKCECGFIITESKLRNIVNKMFNKAKDPSGKREFEDLIEGIF